MKRNDFIKGLLSTSLFPLFSFKKKEVNVVRMLEDNGFTIYSGSRISLPSYWGENKLLEVFVLDYRHPNAPCREIFDNEIWVTIFIKGVDSHHLPKTRKYEGKIETEEDFKRLVKLCS